MDEADLLMDRPPGGWGSLVTKDWLDERLTHQPMAYLAPTAPRGPADQLKAPELLEAAARRS